MFFWLQTCQEKLPFTIFQIANKFIKLKKKLETNKRKTTKKFNFEIYLLNIISTYIYIDLVSL